MYNFFEFLMAEPDQIWTGSRNWTLIEAIGENPVPRMAHAYSSQGHFFLLGGGINNKKNLISDYWLLDTSDNQHKWIQIVPDETSPRPPPLAYSCAILDIPYFYIVGGESFISLSSEIWRYDISQNIFEKALMENEISGITRHGCFLTEDKKLLYIVFGSKGLDNEPSQDIIKCTIDEFPYVGCSTVKFNNPVPGRSSFAYSYLDNTLFIVGGQEYYSRSFGDIWTIDLVTLETNEIGYLYISDYYYNLINKTLHSTNFATIQGMLITFSGVEGNGELFESYSSTIINSISIFNDQNNKTCGLGNYLNFSINYEYWYCISCDINTYKDSNSAVCVSCPKGTYANIRGATDIIQCMPCNYGYYLKDLSKVGCEPCDENCESCLNSTYCLICKNQNQVTVEGSCVCDKGFL